MNQNLLPVMETFYSIQGEGEYQGHAAFFLRLAGCDVGCVWCDVKESWTVSENQYRQIDDIINEIKLNNAKIVVVTGGEPLMYNCSFLTQKLHQAGLRTHLETSGTYPISGDWDWICVSPKKFKKPLESVLQKASELKVVIYHKSDLKWAMEHAEKVNKDCILFLQAEWSKEKEMLNLITPFIQQNPQWKLSLQIHKYLGVR
ncbi:MAG TPA: 7-carboxy-7-deazaguanine synthase QueE [Chitinophagaceae bacterium]|mgnify:CR=1 FL=1|nr:7-carboxy-7-deazaguanine synthase QueE [Chitinophagaceae bacterium]